MNVFIDGKGGFVRQTNKEMIDNLIKLEITALEDEVLARLEITEEGDGVSYEVWIDNTTNETYVIPIVIVRHWDYATKQ